MTPRRYNTRPLLGHFAEALTLTVMVGLTIASATALAAGPGVTEPAEKVYLPLVEVTATPATVRLPTVVVTAKRATSE